MRESTRREIQRLTRSEKGVLARSYGDITLVLVYPNSYRLGMSNLGFQTVYGLTNRNPLSRCERSFLLDSNEAIALESGLTLSSFDVVAFSISFELDYPNVIEILRRAKIPPRSSDRNDSHPLILAGGAAMMLNPEPLADFMDAIFIGEAETVLDSTLSSIAACKGKPGDSLKEELAHLRGVYIPGFYRSETDEHRRVREVTPIGNVPFPIPRNAQPDIETFDTTSEILTPNTVFGKSFLVEVSRGCPRRCKFCAGTTIYSPPRYRSARRILSAVETKLRDEKRVGLLGAAVGDHPHIENICAQLVEQGRNISISSVRTGNVSPQLAAALARGGTRTLTIAPEAGSEKLRRCIGKPLSNRELLQCARIAAAADIHSLKLYFLIGLPGEQPPDVEEIISRVAELSAIIRLKVNVSPFVPKPRTPYQRLGSRPLNYLKSTIHRLRKELRKLPGVAFSAGSPRQSLMETVLSRGNRSLAEYLETGHLSLQELERLACRTIPEDEVLPWNHLGDAAKNRHP